MKKIVLIIVVALILIFFFVPLFPSHVPCIAVTGANCDYTTYEYLKNNRGESLIKNR